MYTLPHARERPSLACVEARAKAANRSDAEQAAIAAAEDAQRHSFAVLSEAWLEVRKAGWAAESYLKAVYVVRTYLQPKIGRLDMRDLRWTLPRRCARLRQPPPAWLKRPSST
ncbi:hypothetical protein [Achromobacter marplatensis]|uniref:hypothetical protein n=1 Tax=Achromobacter marplatensis TaxID=470868 RepID=UPI001F391320|nr:hypothetical protein [Achromobacter marplatensis]